MLSLTHITLRQQRHLIGLTMCSDDRQLFNSWIDLVLLLGNLLILNLNGYKLGLEYDARHN